MAKKKTRPPASLKYSITLQGPDIPWAKQLGKLAKDQGKTPEQVLHESLREWIWQHSGLKRLFRQMHEAGDMMTRSFQVEGMLVNLAKSRGISLEQQSEYLKRAQEERAQYNEQRKAVSRLVREIQALAKETGLPDAIQAAEKLVIPRPAHPRPG